MGILTHTVTIPYGAFLALGGMIGFLVSQSLASLLFGGLTGGALVAVGLLGKKDYEENARDNQFQSATYSYCVISFIISLLVTLVMGDRFVQTGDVFPPGLVAAVSGAMTGFYVWKLTSDDVGTHARRAKRN